MVVGRSESAERETEGEERWRGGGGGGGGFHAFLYMKGRRMVAVVVQCGEGGMKGWWEEGGEREGKIILFHAPSSETGGRREKESRYDLSSRRIDCKPAAKKP